MKKALRRIRELEILLTGDWRNEHMDAVRPEIAKQDRKQVESQAAARSIAVSNATDTRQSAEILLQEIYAKLGVTNQKDALMSINGLRERVVFTRDFESLKYELDGVKAKTA